MRTASILATLVLSSLAAAEDAINLGDRRELFVDTHLVAELTGSAKLELQHPEPQEVVLVTDEPWEGNTCAYYTVFQDGERYRMYYRGSDHSGPGGGRTHPEVTCYAESRDGIHWEKPKLGLYEYAGSKENNIVWNGPGTHNFAPFKDANPDCEAEARYKALAGGYQRGLHAFQSADGIRWKLMTDDLVIKKGAFDSQNLAFWDPVAKVYREYHRGFREGVRDIMTGTSRDFVKWTEPKYLEYGDAPKEHLYTNAVRSYDRAPHLLIGFPTRFLPKTQQVEPTFMASRDGQAFHRWTEAVIPVTAPEDRDGNRSNYMAWGLVRLPADDKHYSVYATEAYYEGKDSRLRRFTYRIDGFTSLDAGEAGGALLTRPITFKGDRLEINFATGKQGSVRVEMQDENGDSIPGFTLADCREMRGDAISQIVEWKNGADVKGLAGRPVRLRFAVESGDVYSFRFARGAAGE